MIANVTEQLWIDFDLDIAVFLDTLAYWIKKNAANQKHFYDGRYWSYNSYPAFTKMFPGWKIETIRRIIRNCVKHELIVIGNYNKRTYDNTNWYTLTDKAIQYYPALSGLLLDTPVDSNMPPVETNRPIPKLLPSSSNNTITTNSGSNSKSKSKPNELMRELIEVYREEFPNNPQPHPRVIATSLQKTLQTLIKKWPELDPDGNPLTPETFQRYLHLLRTTAPKFSLGEYETQNGNRKKNSLETFARWNTVVKFLENQYS
jgi:hypothetical protein